MFKQVIILLSSILFSYIFTRQIIKKKFNKFYFISGIVKYPIKSKLKNAISAKLFEIKDPSKSIIFYTNEKVNHANYIYDKEIDYYYLIEPGYYYYIQNQNNYFFSNDNLEIFYINLKIK